MTAIDRPRTRTTVTREPRPAGTKSRPASGGDRPPTSRPTSGRRRPSARLPWLLAVLGLLGTIGFGAAWASARGDGGTAVGTAQSGSTADLLAAARSFSQHLTNFDGATIDRDFGRITSQATGEFQSQADQFFSTDVRTKLKAAQASSRGEIRSAFVQTATADRGTVFVVVDQTIANNQSPQPQADTLRMELTLVRKGQRWLVERVAVLTAPAGVTAAPSATGTPSGSTPTTSAPTAGN